MTQSLIKRLENAEKADRELDAEIAMHFEGPLEEGTYLKGWTVHDDGPNEGPGVYFVYSRSGRMMRRAPEYTACIGAAFELAERQGVLPFRMFRLIEEQALRKSFSHSFDVTFEESMIWKCDRIARWACLALLHATGEGDG